MGFLSRRLGAGLATAAMVLAGVSVVGAAPASATAADCENGANGFIDIPDNLTGARAPTGNNPRILTGSGANTIEVRLEYGTVSGRQRGWAHLYPRGDRRLLSGDQVWMDWTTNNGASWLQCGPFTAGNLQSKTSAAKTTSSDPNYRFRACARLVGFSTQCTDWW
jgi:hypothetical protein